MTDPSLLDIPQPGDPTLNPGPISSKDDAASVGIGTVLGVLGLGALVLGGALTLQPEVAVPALGALLLMLNAAKTSPVTGSPTLNSEGFTAANTDLEATVPLAYLLTQVAVGQGALPASALAQFSGSVPGASAIAALPHSAGSLTLPDGTTLNVSVAQTGNGPSLTLAGSGAGEVLGNATHLEAGASSQTISFNAAGALTEVQTLNPAAGETSITAQYSAADQETTSTTYTPTDTTIQNFDTLNGDVAYKADYSASGLVQTYYDTENQQPWASLTNDYLTAGATGKTQTSVVYHDGSTLVTTYDPANGRAVGETFTFGAEQVSITGLEGASTTVDVTNAGSLVASDILVNSGTVDPAILVDTTGGTASSAGGAPAILIGTNGATLSAASGANLFIELGSGATVQADSGSMFVGGANGGGVVNGAGLTADVGAGSVFTFNGGGSTVDAGAGSRTTLLNGGGYTFAGGAGSVLTAGAYTNGAFSGAGLVADTGANTSWTGSGGDLTVNAGPNSYTVLQNGGSYVFNGTTGSGLSAGAYTNGTFSGFGITAGTGSNTSWTGSGGNLTVDAGPNSYTVLQNGGGYVFNGTTGSGLSAGNYTNGTFSGFGITAGTGANTSWTGSGGNLTVDAGPNSYTVLQNGGNYVFNGTTGSGLSAGNYTNGTFSGFGITAGTGAYTSWTGSGGNLTVNAGPNSYTTLQNGGSYVFNGTTDSGVTAGAYTNGMLSGAGLIANTGSYSDWTASGGGLTIDAGPNSYTQVQNGGNYVFAGGADAGLGAGAYTNGALSGVGITADTGSHSDWTASGGGLTLNAGPNSYTLLQSGGSYVYTGTTGSGLGTGAGTSGAFSGVGVTASTGSSSSWAASGGGITVDAGAGSSTTLGGGSGYLVSGSNYTVSEGAAGALGTVGGTGVKFADTGSSDLFNLSGSGTVNSANGNSFVADGGSDYAINGSAISVAAQQGAAGTLTGAGFNLTATGANTDFTLGAGSTATTAGTGGLVNLGKSDTVTVTNVNESVNGTASSTTSSPGKATTDSLGNLTETFNGNAYEKVFGDLDGTWIDDLKLFPSANTGGTYESITDHTTNGAVAEQTNVQYFEPVTYQFAETFYDTSDSYIWANIMRDYSGTPNGTAGVFAPQLTGVSTNNDDGTGYYAHYLVNGGPRLQIDVYGTQGYETSDTYWISDGTFQRLLYGTPLNQLLGADTQGDLATLDYLINPSLQSLASANGSAAAVAVANGYSAEYGSYGNTIANQLDQLSNINVTVEGFGGDAGSIFYPAIDPGFETGDGSGEAGTVAPGSVSAPATAASTQQPGSFGAVALSFTGQAVTTTALASSPTAFDARNDGSLSQTAWIPTGEGLLIDDPGGTLASVKASDLVPSFMSLETLDTGHTGQIDTRDKGWADLRVWFDAPGTGDFKQGFVYTLAQLGITSIDLHPTVVNAADHGNTIVGTDTFAGSRGGAIAQLSLNYQPFVVGGHPAQGS